MGVYRVVWTICTALLAGLGIVVGLNALSWVESLSWAVIGSVVYTLAWSAYLKSRERRVGLALVRYAVQGFGGVLAIAGLVALLGTGGALISALALVTAPQVTGWWLPRASRRLGLAAPTTTPSTPAASTTSTDRPTATWVPKPETAAGVALLSDTELCLAWRRSSAVVDLLGRHQDVVRLTAVLENRRHYLDALQHRDPAGFALWLSGAGHPAADPRRFINRQRGTTP